MTGVKQVRLAEEQPLELGRLVIVPAERTIGVGAVKASLEPRTMQVLVLLARHIGEVVGRQVLIDACWESRIVGEDAINRAILKLRRGLAAVESELGIETVARVGYRLSAAEVQQIDADVPRIPDRRRLLVAGATIGSVALVGIGYAAWPSRAPRASRAQELFERGEAAFQQGSRDDNAQAVGFFEQAATIAPRDAPIAGALALALRFEQTFRGPTVLAQSTALADAATARALAIDPRDPDGIAAHSMFVPFGNHWRETERRLRAGLDIAPESAVMNGFLGIDYHAVGRTRDAIAQFNKALNDARFVPILRIYLIDSLFAAGRLGDADRQLEAAVALWPRFANLWWARFWTLALTGRLEKARTHLASTTALPIGIGPSELDAAQLATVALESRAATAIDRAIAVWRQLAASSKGFTTSTIGLAATLGRSADALAMAEAYLAPLFVPNSNSGPGPAFLFGPAMTAIHHEAGFWSLCERVGLGAYWRDSGSRPDIAAARR